MTAQQLRDNIWKLKEDADIAYFDAKRISDALVANAVAEAAEKLRFAHQVLINIEKEKTQ